MEDNKLIAEFMEVVLQKVSQNTLYYQNLYLINPDDENQYYNADGLHIGNTLQYHTSWDWLMPVVEKCLDRHNNLIDGRDVIDTSYPSIAQALQVVSRKETYKAVVEFIKQYNK